MKKWILILTLTSFSSVISQEKLVVVQPTAHENSCNPTSDDICEFPNENAEYPGGVSELYQFIATHIVYPKACIKDKIEGRVYVSFIIEKDGSISK